MLLALDRRHTPPLLAGCGWLRSWYARTHRRSCALWTCSLCAGRARLFTGSAAWRSGSRACADSNDFQLLVWVWCAAAWLLFQSLASQNLGKYCVVLSQHQNIAIARDIHPQCHTQQPVCKTGPWDSGFRDTSQGTGGFFDGGASATITHKITAHSVVVSLMVSTS